jgi:hypothetical protein
MLPPDHFMKNCMGRSLAETNRDLIQTHFMDLHLFQRFKEISGLQLFHLDPDVMPGTLIGPRLRGLLAWRLVSVQLRCQICLCAHPGPSSR